MTTSFTGDLNLGHLLDAAGIAPHDVVVLRHTYTPGGLTPGQITDDAVLEYTRVQGISNKLGRSPAPLWLCFMADGQRRSRFLVAYENHGELAHLRTTEWRHFDLKPSSALASLGNRLVVEWSKDTVNWAKTGQVASAFPVVEIADPDAVPFPGFDRVVLTFGEMTEMVEDSRYASWRTALGSVQGIYVIADSRNGRLYVGKADGAERLLGRWATYARDGHGGNKGLVEQAGLDPAARDHFVFSILQVFGPSTPTSEVDLAESHFKRALLTRRPHGYNHN